MDFELNPDLSRGWFHWIVGVLRDPDSDRNTMGPPVPATKGGQKKQALANQALVAMENGQPRSLPAHPSLGRLQLTFATKKSYMCCTKPALGEPKLVTQFTATQVGERHAPLLSSLAQMASDKQLTRAEIKEVRDAVVMQGFAQIKREPDPNSTPQSSPPQLLELHSENCPPHHQPQTYLTNLKTNLKPGECLTCRVVAAPEPSTFTEVTLSCCCPTHATTSALLNWVLLQVQFFLLQSQTKTQVLELRPTLSPQSSGDVYSFMVLVWTCGYIWLLHWCCAMTSRLKGCQCGHLQNWGWPMSDKQRTWEHTKPRDSRPRCRGGKRMPEHKSQQQGQNRHAQTTKDPISTKGFGPYR